MREEQPQIIVNLRRGRDGRTRIRAGTALLDGDGRRESFDVVHLGLLHLVEELARVGREGLYVFPLSLGKNSVERERRFPRTAQSGDHHQLVAGHFQREVLQVVLTRAADSDEFLRHKARILSQNNSSNLTNAS